MNKLFFILFLFFQQTLLCQEKETITLLFEQDKTKTCDCYNKASKKEFTLSYQDKRYRKLNVTRYLLCRNFFVFDLNKQKFKFISDEEFKNIKVLDINYLLQKQKQSDNKNLNDLFAISIIEKALEGGYVQYNVVWEKQL